MTRCSECDVVGLHGLESCTSRMDSSREYARVEVDGEGGKIARVLVLDSVRRGFGAGGVGGTVALEMNVDVEPWG